MTDIAIRAESLGKRYRLGQREQYVALRDVLTSMYKAPTRFFRRHAPHAPHLHQAGLEFIWALKDTSFEIEHGEVVGIIGRNGAGKSTLLKILSRITKPTVGHAEIHGRVGSLLEVGTGFHLELSGRENIFLNGAILGMRKVEIERRFDEIVAFAELEQFLDTPVKHYSSGMYVRLAFAVAAHLEPEVLLVDEVLAVGDAAFQKKCLGKMGEVAKEGRTVLFVSHNMGTIAQLCPRVLWLERGGLEVDGASHDVIAQYLTRGCSATYLWKRLPTDPADADAVLLSAQISQDDQAPVGIVRFDRDYAIAIEYEVNKPSRDLTILVRVTDASGTALFSSWDTDATEWKGKVRESGRYRSACRVPGHLLRPGGYTVTIAAFTPVQILELHEHLLSFEVSQVGYSLNLNRIGVVTPVLAWDVCRLECSS